MYQNCCDSGEKMPSYYLQTLAGNAYSTDWSFPAAPDLMLWVPSTKPPRATSTTHAYPKIA